MSWSSSLEVVTFSYALLKWSKKQARSEEKLDCPWVADARYSTKQVTAIIAAISTYNENLTGMFALDLHPEVIPRDRRQQLSRGTTDGGRDGNNNIAAKKWTILPTNNYTED